KSNMPAEEKPVTQPFSKIAIIAGAGSLPREIINSLNRRNIKPYVIALKGIANISTDDGEAEILSARIASVGKMMKYLRDNSVDTIILAGSMKRPPLNNLLPDARGLKLINRIRKVEKAGDNSLFSVITKFMNENGFEIIGIDDVAPELLSPKGV